MNFLRLCFVLSLSVILAGCEGVTYPKETLENEVVKLCKREYDIDIKSEVVEQTLAIYIPLKSLLDLTFGMNKDAQDTIQNVLLSASRVVLSTDAGIQFYCIIAQDIRLPELQVIIVKYVDDVKRAFVRDISRGEYFKRTLFDININPQSKKEQTIKNVFKKYDLDPEWEDQILEEFFRSAPLALKDFGYWNDRFYVKNIKLPEFLAEQMAYRVKMRFKEDKDLSKKFLVKAVTGRYRNKIENPFFYLGFDIKINEVLKVLGEEVDKRIVFENVFKEISDCLYGYKFKDFEKVESVDINTNEKLFVSKEAIYAFKKNKLTIEAILNGI